MVTPEKLEQTKDAVRSRLRQVCSHMPEADFEQMVEKIALNELKPSSGWRVPDPRPPPS